MYNNESYKEFLGNYSNVHFPFIDFNKLNVSLGSPMLGVAFPQLTQLYARKDKLLLHLEVISECRQTTTV